MYHLNKKMSWTIPILLVLIVVLAHTGQLLYSLVPIILFLFDIASFNIWGFRAPFIKYILTMKGKWQFIKFILRGISKIMGLQDNSTLQFHHVNETNMTVMSCAHGGTVCLPYNRRRISKMLNIKIYAEKKHTEGKTKQSDVDALKLIGISSDNNEDRFLIDITPPKGVLLKYSPNNIGVDCIIICKNDMIIKCFEGDEMIDTDRIDFSVTGKSIFSANDKAELK